MAVARIGGSRGGRLTALAVTMLLVVIAPVPTATAASAATAVRSANTATFTYDRLHPERTVVGSAISYDRSPGQPLFMTISVVPRGGAARFTATVRNVSGAPLAFGAKGLRVDGVVERNGRPAAGWTVRASTLTSLAPGATRVLTGWFPLGAAGSYTVAAIARY